MWLVRVVRNSDTLSKWSVVRILPLVYKENLVGRKKSTLCVHQVPRQRLITINDDEYFVPIGYNMVTQKNTFVSFSFPFCIDKKKTTESFFFLGIYN